MRKAEIKVHEKTAGWLSQDETGYHFIYDPAWLASEEAEPVSLTLPLKT
jgi:serine/threonine-protein kinase HipA